MPTKSNKALTVLSCLMRKIEDRHAIEHNSTIRILAHELNIPDPATIKTMADLWSTMCIVYDMLDENDRQRDTADIDMKLQHFDLTKTPNPPTPEYWKTLCCVAGNKRKAAKLLQVDERTIRRWCNGDRVSQWQMAELLRRILVENSSDD
jgi:hypothetical protein